MKNYPSNEYKLLQSLKPFLNYKKSSRYPIGIGDDAAIRETKAGERLVLTADTMVENVHFSLKYMTFREVGYKAMAVNLSDIAAMGAMPDAALVQLTFPKFGNRANLSGNIHSLYKGFREACREWDFPIIGGNLSAGPCYMADITLLGRAGKNERLLLRRGARPGDGLWVTGIPGSSAAGFNALRKWGSRAGTPRPFRPLVKKHIRPAPRIVLGRLLARSRFVHAMIDVSDGIAKECHTLAFENRLGILLGPLPEDMLGTMKRLGKAVRRDPVDWFLAGGEDYELLFAAAPAFDPARIQKTSPVPLSKIGTFKSAAKGVHLKVNNDTIIVVEKSGWSHL
jgi:thiamine-monophosphate kinase